MSDKTQVHLQLDTDTKAAWEQAAKNDPEYSSLSHLIRVAVRNELDGEHNGGGQADDRQLATLTETVQNMAEELTDLRSEVRTVRADMGTLTPDSDVKMEVWAEIPPRSALPDEPTPDDVDRVGATVDDIAERLPAYDRQTVQDALTELTESTGRIGIVWGDDMSKHYFKED